MKVGAVRGPNCPFHGKSSFQNFHHSQNSWLIQNRMEKASKFFTFSQQIKNSSSVAASSSIINNLLEFDTFLQNHHHQHHHNHRNNNNNNSKKEWKKTKRGRCIEPRRHRRNNWLKDKFKLINRNNNNINHNNLVVCKTQNQNYSNLFSLPRFFYTNPTSLNEEKISVVEGVLLNHDVAVFTETWWKNSNSFSISNFNL
jgi:hypothetical protein